MATSCGLSGNWPTSVYSNVWTRYMTHFIILISATVASESPPTIVSTLSSFTSFQSSTSYWTSSFASWMVANASDLMTAASPKAASDDNVSKEDNISQMLSEDERRRYMDSLQEVTILKLIPTVIFLTLLSVVGLFGNTMVLLVYSKKVYRNATDIFIMAMAASDLVANLLAIPGEIYDLFYFWDLHNPLLCKCRVYINALTTLTSAQLLLAIAVSRFRKICRPFGKQISLKHAKIISLYIAFTSSLFSIPNAVVYGPQTTMLKAGVSGRQCFTDDKYLHTIWPLVYTGFLMLLFFGCCIPLIVLYILIGLQAWRHSVIHGVCTTHNTPVNSSNTMSDTLDSVDDADVKTKVWRFFKPKNKNKMAPGNSRNVEDTGNGHADGRELNTEALNGRTSPQECPNIHDISWKPKKGKENNHNEGPHGKYPDAFAETLPVIGATSCLEDDKKADRKNDVSEDDAFGKNPWQSGPESRHESLQQKLDDTLTGVCKAREKRSAVDVMESQPPKDSMTTGAGCPISHTTTSLMVPESNGDAESRDGINSCGRKSPRNGTLNSKTDKNNKSNAQRRGLTRTTLMLFIISVVFVIAFVPYLVLMACKFTVPNFRKNMSAGGFTIYHVFLRFYFINSAANAIIYSLCDIKFRNEAKKILRCKT